MKKDSFWKRTRLFILSFLGALLVFGMMFAGTYYFVILRNEQAGNTVTDLPVTGEAYLPKAGDELTVSVLACKDRTQTPELFFLIRFDPLNRRCTLIEVPKTTLVSVRGESKTLAQHYDYGGMADCAQAMANLFLLDQPVYYVRVDPSGIQKIVDFFSGFQYYVPQELITDDYHFEEGQQLLDGRRVASLLFSPAFPSRSDLLSALFRNYFTDSLTNKLDSFYDLLFEVTDTDLNRAVLNELDRPVHYFLRDNQKDYLPLTLKGADVKEGLIPDEAQLEALRAQFSQSQLT